MKIRRLDFDGWRIDRPLNVEIAGNVITITQTDRPVSQPKIEWLDDEYFINLRTGEIKQRQHTESRGDKLAIPEVRRTLRRMRALINSNFFGDRNETFLTLTYKENMQDTRRLYEDLRKFVAKMQRRLGTIKYLTAVEPQQRGAWHAHVLLKQMTSHATYMPVEEIAELWGQGFIWATALKEADNVGAYLSAYLSNTPEDDTIERPLAEGYQQLGTNAPKRVIKGGRLHMYPKGIHIYRASQNMERPIIKKIRPTSAECGALLASTEITYKSRLELIDDSQPETARLINRVSQMQLNRKRIDSAE